MKKIISGKMLLRMLPALVVVFVLVIIKFIRSSYPKVSVYISEMILFWVLFAAFGWIFTTLAGYFWSSGSSRARIITGWLMLAPIPISGIVFPWLLELGYSYDTAGIAHVPGILVTLLCVTVARPLIRRIDGNRNEKTRRAMGHERAS